MNHYDCPLCRQKMFICYDEWGYTPWHIHCKKCNINIGFAYDKDIPYLLTQCKKPNTYIEYYRKQIQFMIEDGDVVIDNETAN